MKDLILKNIDARWVRSARITYIKQLEPLPIVLTVDYSPSRFGYQESFRTVRQAKIAFTKQFYKGNWKSDE